MKCVQILNGPTLSHDEWAVQMTIGPDFKCHFKSERFQMVQKIRWPYLCVGLFSNGLDHSKTDFKTFGIQMFGIRAPTE